LLRGFYYSEDGLGLPELNRGFAAVTVAEQASRRLRALTHEVVLPSNHEELIERAQALGEFSAEEADLVRQAQRAVADVLAVDDFSHELTRSSERQ
jgi:hypothetical protein